MRRILVLLLVLAGVAGCSSSRESEPPRTATEELLISTAVDDALEQLHLDIPPGTRLWVDAANFDGYDQKYAVGAIRNHLLRQGARLVAERKDADAVVEIRSGALSTNKKDMLIGIPSMDLPVPLAGDAKTPELSIVKEVDEKGVAKIGLTAYDAKTGELAPYSPAEPVYGFSDRSRWVVLSLVGWTNSDTLPDHVEEKSGVE
jgi:hypothetical protein